MPSNRRAILGDPFTWLPVLAGVVALALASRGGLLYLAVTVVLLVLSVSSMRVSIARRMWKRSLEVQRAALKANDIDVVLGSSFGGAVALELLARGDWKGPTVLLCPAHRLLAGRAKLPPSRLPQPLAAPVLVVHGTRDETVPLEHSRELVDGTDAKFIEVDDTHRLAATTPEQFKAWIDSVVG
jgi:pimeloyl-ACP methyl ester carboxylesterase